MFEWTKVEYGIWTYSTLDWCLLAGGSEMHECVVVSIQRTETTDGSFFIVFIFSFFHSSLITLEKVLYFCTWKKMSGNKAVLTSTQNYVS